MPVGNRLHRAMRRPVMRTRLVMETPGPAVMLRPGVMRPGMVMGRGRGHMVMGSGFGFRGNKQGSGGKAKSGGNATQERTAAEARAFGTLHDDLLLRRSFFSYRISDGFDFIIPKFLILATRSGFRILSYACGWAARLKHLLQDGDALEWLTPRENGLSYRGCIHPLKERSE